MYVKKTANRTAPVRIRRRVWEEIPVSQECRLNEPVSFAGSARRLLIIGLITVPRLPRVILKATVEAYCCFDPTESEVS
jgi:hypothetical protein